VSEDKRNYAAMRERIEFISENNNNTIQELGGKGVGINGENIKDLRFETFVNFVLGNPDNSIERLRYEERFHEALEKALANTKKAAQKQANLDRLQIPGHGKNGRKQ